MERLRAIIVDDEPLARERLRTLLRDMPEVDVVAECQDGKQALKVIQTTAADVVFLDIQMPGMDGLHLLAELGDHMPAVVFCTAFDEYALRAFEANAVDYLLKPVDAERLQAAVGRAQKRSRAEAVAMLPSLLSNLLSAMGGIPERNERIAVRARNQFQVIRTAEIMWVESADNYVTLHTAAGVHRHRATMVEIEKFLDSGRFIRIHRSYIVNIDQVAAIESWGMGEFLLVLKGGAKLVSSRRYCKAIRDVFGC